MEFNHDVDKEDMRGVLKNFPSQIEEGVKLGHRISVTGSFSKVFILGMGGSAQPGDLLNSYLNNEKFPIFVVKNYNIPKFMDKESLVFVISYSGNTEESISALREAMKTGAKIVTLSSGGKIEEIAKMDHLPHIKVPKGIQPRQAIGYQFFPMLQVLINAGMIKDCTKDIMQTETALKKDIFEENAKNLALKMQGKIPLIYSSAGMMIVAEKWKISFNENAKIPAFYNLFPEMNHNEMNGFENLNGNYFAIMIKDEDDHPKIKKRMDITKELMRKKGVDVLEMQLKGDNKLSRIMTSIHLADWTAYYSALLLNIDPSPVKMVEDLKKALGK